jgi:hypothetical protein
MKKKFIYLAIICTGIQTAHAAENELFQGLDNQIGLGYSYNTLHAYNPNYNGSNVDTTSSNLNLHLEQLFDSNVWLAVDGSFAFKANQNSPGNVGFSDNTQEFGFPASISAKGGYSFNWIKDNQGIQVVPYLTIGRMLNYNGMSIAQNTFTQSYLNLYGGGARVEYAFAKDASIYFDQSIGYLQDPNSASAGEYNQSSMSYTSLLGIKYNVTPSFQIGLQGMFNQTNLIDTSLGYNPITYSYQNTAQSSFGGMLNFAYLYNNDQLMSNLTAGGSSNSSALPNSLLAAFDNSYSVGMGWVNSTNNYKGGSAPSIDSSMNYLNFNVAHLFDNNVWANINAQLVNNISQTNIPAGRVNSSVPTYIGFPGNVTFDVGYGFQAFDSGFQIIPYANAGVIMNMNSYNVRNNSSIMNAISQDMYLQYGFGGRAEYAINNFWQIYADQLIAGMDDRSSLGINAWRSTSSLGVKINPVSKLQLGLKGFYDRITPSGDAFNNGTNSYVPAQQNSLGMQLDIGLRY